MTACRLFKETITNHTAPLQVRGDKGSENVIIAKRVVMLRNTQHKCYLGGRSTHNTRIKRFWREHNTNFMVHFRDEFKRLDNLGVLDTDDNTGMWAFHWVRVTVISQIID